MMYGWELAGTNGWLMFAGMALVAGAILGSVWLIVRRAGADVSAGPTAADIVRERFARGEITPEQFEDAKRALV